METYKSGFEDAWEFCIKTEEKSRHREERCRCKGLRDRGTTVRFGESKGGEAAQAAGAEPG